MEKNSLHASNLKLFVCLYSDPNFFALNLLENLLAKNCLVNIITTNTKKWKERTSHLNKSKFSITEQGNNFVRQQYNYAIYCGGFLKKSNAYLDYKYFANDDAIKGIKSIAIFPAEVYSEERNLEIPISDNLCLIYLGDIFGPRMDFESDLFISQNMGEILYKRKLSVEISELFYPIFVSDAAKIISKWLFSFGPYGKQIFVLGPETTTSNFWKVNKRIVPDLQLDYVKDIEVRKLPKGFETFYVEGNLPFYLAETYNWISLGWNEDKVVPKPKIVKVVKKKKREVKPLPKFVKPLFFTIIIVLMLPFLTMLIPASLFYFSYKSISKDSTEGVENKMLVSKTFFVISRQESEFLSYLPVVGNIYKETAYVSWLGENVSETVVDVMPMLSTTGSFFSSVLGNEIYDPTQASVDIKKTLEDLYRRVSIIQVETKSAQEKGTYTAKLLNQKVDFERLKTLTSKGSVLAENLPFILGKDKKQSYLILFQNNMELRPTGGFIGSFGVTNFEGGRMNELTVNDVYSADGQLKGHVEPPEPIRLYLDEANWWLRDSNWDPDFPTSAQRAEWFLDKETDQQVDGVVSIDLGLVRDILKYTGPVFLPDYNLDISDKNLYEKTQEEVQNNFFPGTHKKASFLTALSRSLIAEITKLDSKKKILVMKAIFENLEGRHVQVYLHHPISPSSGADIGWGGTFDSPNCGQTCFPDYLGIVEANLGVNKANYFLKRSVNLDVNISGKTISKILTINLVNSANQALGPSGRYKVYMRLVVPDFSKIHSVKRLVGQSEQVLTTEITNNKGKSEIGIITEVLGGQSQKIQYSWDNVIPNDFIPETYGLFIRKQAGVENDSWVVTLATDEGGLESNLPFNLTQGGSYTYNMALSKDFVSIFKFKK